MVSRFSKMAIINFFRSIFVLFLVVPVVTLTTALWVVIGVLLFRRTTSQIKAAPRWWSRMITRGSGVSVQVDGMDNLEPGKPYIFAANHQSQFDIFALDGYLLVDFRWVAKKELLRIPLVGLAMKLAGTVFIDRSRGRQAMKSLAEAAQRIADGTSVVIFPEGTRSRNGKLQDFKSGAMYLAIKSGVDIVPMSITGSFDILPKGRFLTKPGQINIRIGKPVSTKDYNQKQKQELADLLHEKVAGLLSGP